VWSELLNSISSTDMNDEPGPVPGRHDGQPQMKSWIKSLAQWPEFAVLGLDPACWIPLKSLFWRRCNPDVHLACGQGLRHTLVRG